MMKQKILVMFSLTILISTSSLVLANNSGHDLNVEFTIFEDTDSSIIYTPLAVESPISIDGDSEFASVASSRSWSGDGTIGNPYLIDGVEISADLSTDLIYIANTNHYFRIQNSQLTVGYNGIFLDNAPNGVIYNNVIDVTDYGITVGYSDGVDILDNTITNAGIYGIYSDHTDDSVIANNVISDNFDGALFYQSDDNNITNNFVFDNDQNGFIFASNSRLRVLDNVFYGNQDGLSFSDPYKLLAANNTFYDNTRGLYASDSRDNLFTQNLAYNNDVGLLITGQSLSGNERSNVTHNIAYNNSEAGIRITLGEGMYIHDNHVYDNARGLEFVFGLGHNVFDNNIHDNDIGMYLDSIDTYSITNHNLVNNGFFIAYYVGNLIYHKLKNLSGNTVNGLPVMYLNNTADQTISGTYGQVLLVNTDRIDIINTMVSNSSAGIFLSDARNTTISDSHLNANSVGVGIYQGSEDNLIENSIISNSSIAGIEVIDSPNNIIDDNEIVSNQQGMYIEESDFTIINFNKVHHNLNDGLYTLLSNNLIIANNVFNQNGFNDPSLNSTLSGIGTDSEVATNALTNGAVINFGINHNILANIFYYNFGYGLVLSAIGTVTNNFFHANNYQGNPNRDIRPSQAFTTSESSFSTNFFTMMDSYVDTDDDGVIDEKALIDCGINPDGSFITCETDAEDEPTLSVHALTSPVVDGFNVSPGVFDINWIEAIDTFNHDVTYKLFIRPETAANAPTQVVLISEEISNTDISVSISGLAEGFYYAYVVAYGSDGLVANSEVIQFEITEFVDNTGDPTDSDDDSSSTPQNLTTTSEASFVSAFLILLTSTFIMLVKRNKKYRA